MITIEFNIDNLANLVWQRTVYASDLVLDQNPLRPEVLPLNDQHRDMFNTLLKQVANTIWFKLAKWATTDSSVIEPFILNFDLTGSESEYPNTLVYILDEPTNYTTGRHNALLTNAIQDTIVSFITYRWMMMKGASNDPAFAAELQSYNENLSAINRAMEYGKRAVVTHRTF